MGCPGGCLGNNNYSGGNYTPGNIQALSHADCAGVTIDLLNIFLRLINCVESNNLYTQVNLSIAEVTNGKTLLTAWIAAKELNPASCDHQEKLPLVQAIVNRIVAFGQC